MMIEQATPAAMNAYRERKERLARIAAKAIKPAPEPVPEPVRPDVTTKFLSYPEPVRYPMPGSIWLNAGNIKWPEPPLPSRKYPKIEWIQMVVARTYNVSRIDILSQRRTANVVRPRQIAMYLTKELTLCSLPEIGRRFGGRDHTTVLHAVRKITALVAKDKELFAEVTRFKELVEEKML